MDVSALAADTQAIGAMENAQANLETDGPDKGLTGFVAARCS